MFPRKSIAYTEDAGPMSESSGCLRALVSRMSTIGRDAVSTGHCFSSLPPLTSSLPSKNSI